MTIFLANLLKPFFLLLLFVTIVAPTTLLLYRVIPDGRVTLFLFRVGTGPYASTRDKVAMTLGVFIGYVVLIAMAWATSFF